MNLKQCVREAQMTYNGKVTMQIERSCHKKCSCGRSKL